MIAREGHIFGKVSEELFGIIDNQIEDEDFVQECMIGTQHKVEDVIDLVWRAVRIGRHTL